MPERLALFGDVHANSHALTAVLDAIRRAGIENGACTGDLVMRGIAPQECVSAVRRTGWPCVMGNTDRKVALRARREPGHPKASRLGSRAWSTNQLSAENLAYLGGLPMLVRLTLKRLKIVLMHGGPDDPRDAIDADTSEKQLDRLVASLGSPDCIVNGHTHRALIRSAAGCLFVNPGSVGEAVDGDRRPRWAWLEAGRSGLRVHLESVDQDLATVRFP